MSDDKNKPEYLSDQDPERNLNYWRQDHGGMVTNHNGVADALLKNDKVFSEISNEVTKNSF